MAFTSVSGANAPGVDPLRLHRYNVEPYSPRTFELVLAGACDLIAVKDTVTGTHARRVFNAALGTSTKSTRFEPVAYEPPQRDAVRELMEEVWGEAASVEDFEWWHDRNPTGRRLISLVLDDGRVAGASAMSFLPMRLNGESRDVAFALDAATHPDYRGQGLWSVLELHNEQESAAAGAPAVLGFTNPVAGPILVGKLGWADLAGLRLWARPLQVRAKDAGFREGGGETLVRFGADAEQLYERARCRLGKPRRA